MSVLAHPAIFIPSRSCASRSSRSARHPKRHSFPGSLYARDCVTISHEFQPVAYEVGGDYLDYFLLPDGLIGLYVGDVCGKGFGGALRRAGGWHTARRPQDRPGPRPGCLPPEQAAAASRITERYTVIQYAIFDSLRAQMRITSAGMLGPLLIVETNVASCNLPDSRQDYSVSYLRRFTLNLEPGDSVLFCTDG